MATEEVREVQQQQQPQEQQQAVDVKDLIAQAVGVDKSVIERVSEDTLDRVVKVVDVLARMQELPQQLRIALANFVAGKVMEEEDPTIKAIREAIKLRAILETINEKKKEDDATKELLKEVLALMKESLAKRDGQEELVRKLDELMAKLSQPPPPQQQKDPIDQLIETLEKLKKLNDLLEPKRPEPLINLDNLIELSKKLEALGLDVKPKVKEEFLRQLQEEAYKRGVEDGVKRAQLLADVVSKVVDSLPKYAEIFTKFANRKP